MAVVIGVGRAAENGILFNNVEAIEKIIKIDTVCFDKTGTLTTGEMHLKSIITLNDILQNDLLKYVFSIEKYSNHPIAKSIFNYCVQNNVDIFADVNNINIEDGLGISGIVSGKEVVIGNGDLMTKHRIDCGSYADENKNGNLFIGIDGKLSGLIEFEDKIKEEAKEIVSKLKNKNLGIFLISGDGEEVTKSVADKLEIENYTFRTMPEDKEKIISGLQAENKNVAMIGDGINDAPSLARANVGIAVGTGQDIAIDSADVILVKGDLRNLIKSINISSKTVSIIKQNIFWAFFYNILAIPLAAGIFSPWGIIISPVMAAMFMAFSDVITVMINSLRLKYVNIN
jgi:Cu+-exporting ATPase